MKNILILVVGFLASNSYGQCIIAGNTTTQLNEITSFTVDTKAQCEECYSWKATPESNLIIDGNNTTNKINVKSMQAGKGTISVSLFTGQDLVQCEKLIEVLAQTALAKSINNEKKQTFVANSCGILIDDFTDVKVNDAVISFFTNGNSSDYTNQWSVIYANDEIQESTEKIPQFFFSEINYITTVKLKVTRNKSLCAVTFTKKYDENYWKSKRMSPVEQKVYQATSYEEYVHPKGKAKTDSKNKVSPGQ